MFKEPFSFKGRIRRKEYGISFIIYFVAALLMQFLFFASANEYEQVSSTNSIIFIIVFVPLIWFILAQAVKRSHDIGNSGWFVLIPFYSLYLLFATENIGPNRWGDNPKGLGNDVGFEFERGDQV